MLSNDNIKCEMDVNGVSRKQKLHFTSDDILWSELNEPKKKKKKSSKKSNASNTIQYNNGGNDQFKNHSNFSEVYARPENLLPTPEIFKKKKKKKRSKKKKTFEGFNPFMFNLISNKAFEADVKNRFIQFLKPVNGNNEKQTSTTNNSWNNHGGRDIKKDGEERREENIKKDGEERREENIKKDGEERREENIKKDGEERREENIKKEPSFDQSKNKRNIQNLHSESPPKSKTTEKLVKKECLDTSTSGTSQKEAAKNEVDIYKIAHGRGVIFHMHHPCEFSFHGEIKITVIVGEVEVLGYPLNDSSTIKTVNVYSPNLYVPMIIESQEPKTDQDVKIKARLNNLLSENDMAKLLSKLKSNHTILQIEKINSEFGVVLNTYLDKQIFPKDVEDFSSESKSLKELKSTFNFNKHCKGIRKSAAWAGIAVGKCVVICGGPDVGKSTLLKYFVNQTVARNEKVLCLDFDPGQPEFTPSGCLSAVIVDQPLLGPNFTHMIDPEIMVFFGTVDVNQNPGRYLESVNYIIESCRQREDLLHMTWLVNTMGYNKGVGVDLMVAILKLLQPDVVVQIRSSDYRRNYPVYLTPRNVNQKKKIWSLLRVSAETSFDLEVVSSVAEKNKAPMKGGLKSRQLRDILTLSYFSKMASPPYYDFNAIQPYVVSFSRLYLAIESMITPSDILKAFNGSIVALSHFQHKSEEIFVPEGETCNYFKIVVQPRVGASLGLGFIRGIDIEQKKFYVLTHLPPEKLDQVNCLYLGKIVPPYSMFLHQDDIRGHPPYTSLSTISSVQKVNRLFRISTVTSSNDK